MHVPASAEEFVTFTVQVSPRSNDTRMASVGATGSGLAASTGGGGTGAGAATLGPTTEAAARKAGVGTERDNGLCDSVMDGLVVRMREVLEEAEACLQCRGSIANRAFDALPERKTVVCERDNADSKQELTDRLSAAKVGPQPEIEDEQEGADPAVERLKGNDKRLRRPAFRKGRR